MSTVAALYIDPRGPYPKLHVDCPQCIGVNACRLPMSMRRPHGVDCWDASRDARLYDGPHPVVAHPPCGPWGRLRHLYRGTEHDCAPRAVEQVRKWGGVLEHPAGSLLWEHCGLPVPDFDVHPDARLGGKVLRVSTQRNDIGEFVDSWGGYTVEIDQCEWGHVARKRTWLYLVGVPREALEAPPFPGRQPTHSVWSGKQERLNGRSIKCCSAQQRRRTPPLFAELLVRFAQSVQR